MANTLDILRDRLRQAGTVGLGDTLAYQLIDYAQKTFNAKFARQVSSKDVTVSADTLILDVRSDIDASATNIVSAKYSSETLIHLENWRELAYYDRSWLTRTSATEPFKIWTPIGTDLVVVYPGCTVQKTVTFYYADLTTTLDDATDDMSVDAEDEEAVYRIAETVAHLHMRNFPEAKRMLNELKRTLLAGFPGATHVRNRHGAD